MDAKNANQIGKYLYNHIDGAFKYRPVSNTCEVYMTVLYQRPIETRKIGEWDVVYEMTIVIDITHYAGKIRLNMIEVSPEECTLGHVVLTADKTPLEKIPEIAFKQVKKFLYKRYAEYNFLF